MINDIFKQIDANFQETVQIRRYLHQHPELSFKEVKTAQYIVDFYKELNIPVTENVGGNGVVAELKGLLPGKTIALRADFDALPIQDQKEVAYKSKTPGVMHACGHDGHTATLLSLAKVMSNYVSRLEGTIIFVHQHAEELAPGGAKPILDSGILDHVDAIFGTHLWSTTPVGTIETTKGPIMAGVDRFEIKLQGEGGHGGYPHETKDTIVIGAEIVTSLQQIVSRKLNPMDTAVLTIGEFKAGNAFNIIADEALIIGTVRYFNPETQKIIMKEMKRIVNGIASAHNISCEIDYQTGYPPLINHSFEASLLLEACAEIPGINESLEGSANMAGEDFSYYMLEKPGAFFFTGAKPENGKTYPHHHPKFDFDERALPIAAKGLIAAYFKYQTI